MELKKRIELSGKASSAHLDWNLSIYNPPTN